MEGYERPHPSPRTPRVALAWLYATALRQSSCSKQSSPSSCPEEAETACASPRPSAPVLGLLSPPPHWHIEADRPHKGLKWQNAVDALNCQRRLHDSVVQTRIRSLQGHRILRTRQATLGPQKKEAVEDSDRLSRLVHTQPHGLAGARGRACESGPGTPLDQPLIGHSDVRQSTVTVPGARGCVEVASDYHGFHFPGPAGQDLAC